MTFTSANSIISPIPYFPFLKRSILLWLYSFASTFPSCMLGVIKCMIWPLFASEETAHHTDTAKGGYRIGLIYKWGYKRSVMHYFLKKKS